MGSFILSVMGKYGYLGICFLIAVENIFPPIPSELILTFGGFLTTYTKLFSLGVIIAATIGSLIGAILLYYLGTFIKVKNGDLNKANKWFRKYGTKAVLFGRFIPIIRSLISIPAGAIKMNMPIFIVYTTIGSFIWNFVLVYTGAFLGDNWLVFASFLSKYSKVILVIIILVLGLKLLKNMKNLTRCR